MFAGELGFVDVCHTGRSKTKSGYFYKPSIGEYNYGDNHFMKPERVRLTDKYVKKNNLYKDTEIVREYRVADETDIIKFHSKDYVDLLKSVAPGMIMNDEDKNKFGIDEECPAFEGVYEFSQLSDGGSIAAASYLNDERADLSLAGELGFVDVVGVFGQRE